MNDALDPQATPKQPTQQRAKDRFERILAAAEKLLIAEGLAGFSIPALAEQLDYTRGSVYAYFPTPYAILNELAARYLKQLEEVFFARADELVGLHWREAVALVVDHAVRFHNSHPAARLLILGGAVTDDSYRAQELTNKRLGDLGRMLWDQNFDLPKGPPDLFTLAADIGTACFRRSVFEHGSITPAYREAAVAAMTNFLAPYVKAAVAPQRAAPARREKRSLP
jgi:AcrR family transcriptional regulator